MLYTDNPIIIFARKESWMYCLAKENPDSGVFFADVNEIDQLAKHIGHIITAPKTKWNREKLRNFFSRENCIKEFLNRCRTLLVEQS